MSADAKAWNDGSGWCGWRGLHDGDCKAGAIPHDQGGNLSFLVEQIERCMGNDLRWEFRQYPDGQIGLVGWTW